MGNISFNVRAVYDAEGKEWMFSASDIAGVLADPKNPRKYWHDIKKRLEWGQLSAKIGQLKLPAADGKLYRTDVLNREGAELLARRIKGSPDTESFIGWLAQFDGKNRKYVLKHKNKDVLEIELDEYGKISMLGRTLNGEHLPVGTAKKGDADLAAVREWWENRSIPAIRDGLNDLLTGLKALYLHQLICKSFGLSLSDQYWIRRQDRDLKWEDVNFFHNSFSDDAGDLLFGKTEIGDPRAVSLLSPDLTTDGVLKKRWMIIGGRRCLIKGGTLPNNQEVANEVLASRICGRLGIPFVNYGIIELDGARYCVCDDFITGDTELVAAWHIKKLIKKDNNTSDYDSFIAKAEELGVKDARRRIDMMMVLDFIIANTDRHYNNFGLVRDADTLEWISVAPVYDSGTSMWCKELPSEMDAKGPKLGSKPFRTKHSDQIKLVKDLSWLDLNALDGIENEYAEILSGSVPDPSGLEARNRTLCIQLRRRIELLRKMTEDRG